MNIFSSIFKKKSEKGPETIKTPEVPAQNQMSYNSEIKNISSSIEGLAKSVRELENTVSDTINKISDISSKVESNQSEISSIKNNMEKVFSIYEILVKNYNPFIQDEEREEKQIEPVNTSQDSVKIDSNDLPLDKISDNPTVASILIGWLSYLIKKSNDEEVDKALDYYEEINWITEKVKIKLKEYLNGLIDIEGENKKLTPMDHIVSLYIISKLSKLKSESNIERLKDLYGELIEKGYISPIKR
ncbi:flagella protein [Nanobdella aerobiophila]|uniref:Flagella protein n=1 Tax=Nanobdella aerobiophila TaxID=2586965 RepID=A0A915SK11_9ARCH|nr:FlaD/FlaE family flagellar protein [Nanobdella aerobiophila]BBL45368.1 flagella protein [Nanobdella aerobiophila]